jgi:hypothetical protein
MSRNTLYESAQRQNRATHLSIILLTPTFAWPRNKTHTFPQRQQYAFRSFIVHVASSVAILHCVSSMELTYMHRHGTGTGNNRKARRICQERRPREHFACHTTFVSIGRWIQETGKLQIRKPDFEIRRNVRSTCTWSEDILNCDEESPSDSHNTVHNAGLNYTSTLTVCRQQ